MLFTQKYYLSVNSVGVYFTEENCKKGICVMIYYINTEHIKNLGRQNARSFASLLLKCKASGSVKIVLEEKRIEFYDLKPFRLAVAILRREYGSEWIDRIIYNRF